MSLKLFSSLFALVLLVSMVVAHNSTEEVTLRYSKVDMAYSALGMKEEVYGPETLLHFLDSLDERGYTKEDCVQTSNEDDSQHTVTCKSLSLYSFSDELHSKYASQYFSNVIFSHQTQINPAGSVRVTGKVVDGQPENIGECLNGYGDLLPEECYEMFPNEDDDGESLDDLLEDAENQPCADNDADCNGEDDQEQIDRMAQEVKDQEDQEGRDMIAAARERSDQYAKERENLDYAQRERDRQEEHNRIVNELRAEKEYQEQIQLAQEDEAQQAMDEEQRMLAEKEERRNNNPRIEKDGKEYYPEVEKNFWGNEKVVWRADDGSEMSSRQADKAIENGAEFIPAQNDAQIAKAY